MKRTVLLASMAAILTLGISNAQTNAPTTDSVTQLVHWVNEIPTSVNFGDLSGGQSHELYVVFKNLINTAISEDQAAQALKDISANLNPQDLQTLQNHLARDYSDQTALIDFNDVWAQFNVSLDLGMADVGGQ